MVRATATGSESASVRSAWLPALVGICACTTAPAVVHQGVYTSGANAIIDGVTSAEVRVWGPDGTRARSPVVGPVGATFVGQAGPLWRVDRDVAAPPKPPTVPAELVERAGIRMKSVLGTSGPPSVDAARPGGVYVRSIIKVRQPHAPPFIVVTATGDDVGAGVWGGPPDVRAGNNCKAAVATVDIAADKVISSHLLDDATRICAVPDALGPVDLDGDGGQDFLVYGQEKQAGFRAWFRLMADGTLVARASDVWTGIP